MDSMEVNKGIAAVLVVGIVFFLTGLIGDNLVSETPPSKPALAIKSEGAAPAAEPAKPEPLQPVAPLLAQADPKAGEAYAKKVCTVCHTLNDGGKPLVGPNLYGVVGGPHDHEQGFNYSEALQKFKGQPWTFEALNEWLFKPSQYAPGTRMTFAGIPSAKERANVIDYLRTLSHNPVPLPSAEAAPAATPNGAGATPSAPAAGVGAPATPGNAAPSSPAPAEKAPPPAAGTAPPAPPSPEQQKKP